MLALVLLWGWLRGRETRSSLRDRLGMGGRDRPDAPHIWLHGASVGELQAARHLIDVVLAETGCRLVLTANTATGVALAKGWDLPNVQIRRAPADAFGAAARFLRHWNVVAQITLENELWPNRIRACDKAGVPIFGVGTRAPGGATQGGIVARIASQALASYQAIWPMHDAARAELLGITQNAKIRAPYNAKATHPLPPKSAGVTPLLAAWQGKDIVLAASTHPPEERLLAEAVARAHAANPALRVIIAPRHPDRGPRIARSLENLSLPMACRSEKEEVTEDTLLYLADTMGEMGLWYAQAPRTIIGGTFAPKGGHTPIEPILAGSFVLHGPDVANHQDSFAALDAAGGARLLADQDALLAELSRPASRDELARGVRAASTAVHQLSATARAMTLEIAKEVASAINT